MGNLISRSNGDSGKGNKRTLEVEENESTKKVRLESTVISEECAGIIAYVNSSLQGFHSILKYRAEDFLVNEVDMEKNIVHLTSIEAPNTRTKGHEINILEPQEFDKQMANIMGEEFAVDFRKFLNTPKEEGVVLSIEADKEKRVSFYRLLENHLEAKLATRAKEGKVNIQWPTATEYHDEYIDWKTLGGDYLQLSMVKSGVDTMNAINIISSKSGIQAKHFGYAGTKDARAITTQALTLKKIKPGRVLAVSEELAKSGIHLGDYKFVPNGLSLGDLGGNHFAIVLRDVKNIEKPELQLSLESLRDNGFLNYFGMQRFGTSSIMTHTVGREIMKKNYKAASDMLLYPRSGDREDFDAARQLWKKTGDAEATLEIFPKRGFSERKLLVSYTRKPDNHEAAIKNLPKTMLSLYSHAYQSYVWNRVVSERANKYGSNRPLVGDLVLVDKKENDKNDQRVFKTNSSAGRRDHSNRKVPKILTEEDVDNYSIEDVVYPLPGKLTVYPENEVKEFYEKIFELTVKFSGLNGDYRPMLAKPENMNWSFIRYNDPVEKLCNTDVDRLQGLAEPKGIEDGKFLALKVEFTLGTSQYATMALREIMRAETSSRAQSSISHQ